MQELLGLIGGLTLRWAILYSSLPIQSNVSRQWYIDNLYRYYFFVEFVLLTDVFIAGLGASNITQNRYTLRLLSLPIASNVQTHQGLMWNIALDGSGNPKLPGTNSCGGAGCRPLVTVNSDGSYSPNQECKHRKPLTLLLC